MEETATRPLVLVIDDDDGIREGIVDLLEEEGFAAVGACNGLEALNFLADSKRVPSLILLDLMMPVLDGWTFCKVRQGVSMLMEIPVVAEDGGTVLEICVAEGESISEGDVVAILEG